MAANILTWWRRQCRYSAGGASQGDPDERKFRNRTFNLNVLCVLPRGRWRWQFRDGQSGVWSAGARLVRVVTPVASVNILQFPGGAVLAPDVGDPRLLEADIADDVVFFIWSWVTTMETIHETSLLSYCKYLTRWRRKGTKMSGWKMKKFGKKLNSSCWESVPSGQEGYEVDHWTESLRLNSDISIHEIKYLETASSLLTAVLNKYRIGLADDGNSLDIMGRFETFYHWDLGASRRRTDGQFPSLYFGAGAGGLGEWYLAGLCWHLYCAHSCSIFKMAVLAFWAIFLKKKTILLQSFH